jgi:hypothetical protein
MAALASLKILAIGERTKLTDTPITTGGGAGTIDFDVPPHGQSGDYSLLLQAVGTVTSLSADLQISLDGAVTFVNLVPTVLVAATPVKLVTPVVAGARYRLNVTAAPTSADLWAVCN